MNNINNKRSADYIPSFIRRERGLTPKKLKEFERLWAIYGLELRGGLIEGEKIFGRSAKVILEIGFGYGEVLFSSCKSNPNCDYLGIEVYRPGLFALLSSLDREGIKNVKVYLNDAIGVLSECIPSQSVDEVRLFFADPWPKRRHHKRRIVQAQFVESLKTKLKPGGIFHFATDVDDYAVWTMKIISSQNCSSYFYKFYKPICGSIEKGLVDVSKCISGIDRKELYNFEQALPSTNFGKKAIKEGRGIHEFVFFFMV